MTQEEQAQFQNEIQSKVLAKINDINNRKEEILEAFIAKYGYEPDKMQMCVQQCDDGITQKIWVEHKLKWDELQFIDAMLDYLIKHYGNRHYDIMRISMSADELIADIKRKRFKLLREMRPKSKMMDSQIVEDNDGE